MSVLGIDVDGVLANFNAAYVRKVVEVTEENHSLVIGGCEHIKFSEALTLPWYPPVWDYPEETAAYSPKQMKAVWRAIMTDDEFWLSLAPHVGAKDGIAVLDSLRLQGHAIYFITARPGIKSKLQTEIWLEVMGFMCPTVIMSGDKAAVTRLLTLDAYIDDRLTLANDVMRLVRDECMLTRVYLKEMPYNMRPVALDMDQQVAALMEGEVRDPALKVVSGVMEMLKAEGLV